MLDLLRTLLLAAPGPDGACALLLEIDAYRRMLPVPNLLRKGKPARTRVTVGFPPKRRTLLLGELIDEVLDILIAHGGEHGIRLVKSYCPAYGACIIEPPGLR